MAEQFAIVKDTDLGRSVYSVGTREECRRDIEKMVSKGEATYSETSVLRVEYPKEPEVKIKETVRTVPIPVPIPTGEVRVQEVHTMTGKQKFFYTIGVGAFCYGVWYGAKKIYHKMVD